MNKTDKNELLVAAIENGTVIDHIPSDKVFSVVYMLGLHNLDNSITVGSNLSSNKMGKKGIIKIANKYFSESEVNKLSLIAPNIVLNTIKDFKVAHKYRVSMPTEIKGIVKCPNPKCISNNEPMSTRFHTIDKTSGVIQCCYCNRTISLEEIKII